MLTLFFKSYDFDQKGHLLEFTWMRYLEALGRGSGIF